MIPPGSMIGVLGGGQLGKMFADAARRLGYRVAVWDPDPEAPGLRGADLALSVPFTDRSAFAAFSSHVQAVTYEWENIPIALCEALEQTLPVRPASRILRILQNRIDQKKFLTERGFPVAPYREVRAPNELVQSEVFGFPCVCKAATSGYDGKGQWRLNTVEELETLRAELQQTERGASQWILEQWIPFEKEVSVIVVRSHQGECRVYPVGENVHEDGILRTTRIPADLEPPLLERTMTLGRSVIEALDGVGVFCVEMFLIPNGQCSINEIAPRPHNSGHYSLDACTVSQFEQQVRAVCHLPLGEVRLLSPAVMVNLLGDTFTRIQAEEQFKSILQRPGTAVHFYGKRVVRPGRKMGHVTVMAEKIETAWDVAESLLM